MLRLPFYLLLLSTATAAPVEQLLRDGRAAETRLDPAAALVFFQQADAARPGDPVILQKIAKQYSDQVPGQPTDDARREFATRALDYAQRAVALAPDNAVNVTSLAICHGHLALLGDTRAKVAYSKLIKEECERAIQLDPNNAWAHHLLGRWHGEVAAFGPVARFFAKLLYGGIPPASAEEGYRQLTRATELEPGELNHWIDLGFACAATGRLDEARRDWRKGLAMRATSTHDAPAKQRAREALRRLE